eukprot:CAMPEP_0116551502 /NCGR_PEP_ID=MMETSP0397-20121206/5995_1 /TAXON_ID=216820 /ORGANISM="Cyclophora tenuis, Strain ECT3854" /LENGTH=170 /DNA_ID=CAMNT_0004076405 /DNA_START=184 /DNA_END=696 /DNA_ORIENTATION=+
MLQWNHAIKEAYDAQQQIGPPDELFFPTILKLHYTTTYFDQQIVNHRQLVWMEWTDTDSCSPNHGRPPQHPCTFTELSVQLLESMQQQQFWFMRKILPYTKIVYGANDPVQEVSGHAVPYSNQLMVDVLPSIIQQFEQGSGTTEEEEEVQTPPEEEEDEEGEGEGDDGDQ